MKINFGGGYNNPEGFHNVDLIPEADTNHNLNEFPYPFKDNVADSVICWHTLEHMRDRAGTVKEIERVLKPGAIAHIKVPYFAHSNAIGDIDHRNFWGILTVASLKGDHNSHWRPSFSKVGWRLNFGRVQRFNPFIIPAKLALWLYWPLYEDTILKYLCPGMELEAWLTK